MLHVMLLNRKEQTMMTSYENKKTGVVYDERLTVHYSAWNPNYTERPERVKACVQRCQDMKLLDRCKRIPVREATEDEMGVYHTQKHIGLLRHSETLNEEGLKQMSQKYDYTYMHNKSFISAKLALGGVIDLVDEVVSGKIQNGMAIVRPPGHHAMKEEFCGYCYLSNVGIAAHLALDNHKLKKILILDWDVHHGQGTQYLFYDDPRVLFASIHRYEYGHEWPHLRESDYDFVGQGSGKGFNINIPLNETACGNDDYMAIFFNALLPIFYEFNPELVIVSAGFDCAIGCPEGEMCVTPACFAHFISLLTPLANGRIVLALEGGYNLKSLPESAMLSLRGLLGDPVPRIGPVSSPKLSVIESVYNVIKVQRSKWRSLCYQDLVPKSEISLDNYRYPQVLTMPPVKGVEFFDSQNHTGNFPLIQECFNEQLESEKEKLNCKIDLLIRSTNLVSARQKLSIVSREKEAAAQNLKKALRQSGINVDQSISDIYLSSCDNCKLAKSALESMASKHSQSAVAFLDENRSKNSNVADFFSKKPLSDHLDRVLVLEFGEMEPMLLQDKCSVLYISIVCVAATENGHTDCGTESSCDNRVKIALPQTFICDQDMIAVTNQLLLPVAYEFDPDTVIIKLAHSSQDQHSIECSPAAFGHVSQQLMGLAEGHLLVLCYGQETGGSKLLQCALALLNQPTCGLVFGLPTQGTIAAIKQLKKRLSSTWTSFAFTEAVPSITDKEDSNQEH